MMEGSLGSKDFYERAVDLPELNSTLCVVNPQAETKMSLRTCHVGRVINVFRDKNSVYKVDLELYLRPELFPENVDHQNYSINEFLDVLEDCRHCHARFELGDIISPCTLIRCEPEADIEALLNTTESCEESEGPSPPTFALRYRLVVNSERAYCIQPLMKSRTKMKVESKMEVLSERGINMKLKPDPVACLQLLSPTKVVLSRIDDEVKENVCADSVAAQSSPSISNLQSVSATCLSSSVMCDTQSITRPSRGSVRRSLDSELSGPPAKQTRVESTRKLKQENAVDEEGRSRRQKKVDKDCKPRQQKSFAEDYKSTDSDATGEEHVKEQSTRRSSRHQPLSKSKLKEDTDFESDNELNNQKSKQGRKSEAQSLENDNKRSTRASNREPQESNINPPSQMGTPEASKSNPKACLPLDIDKAALACKSPGGNKTPQASHTSRRNRESSALSEDVGDCFSPEDSTIPLARRSSRKTPIKTPKNSTKTPLKSPKTPKARTQSRTLSKGNLTPSMPERSSAPLTPISSLEQVRKNLHVSAVPMSLPCREAEYRNIYFFLENKIRDAAGGCMYISGVPGTGKTATVHAVIRSLKKHVSNRKLKDFQYIEVNGLRMTEPRQVFVQVLKALTGQKCTPQQAQDVLAQRFCSGSSRNKTVVLLVDEVDMLRNRRQDVIYNLFDWPSKPNSRFIVLTIANTMDLPERLLKGRVTSRLGLTRLTFQPYSYKQLQEIVMSRLQGSNSFQDDAVELVARKVAACSGDVRRALDICRRASELVEEGSLVTMPIINKVLSQMMNSANVCLIKACSEVEKLFLQAVVAENERTGVEETSFISVYRQFQSLCALSSLAAVNISEAMAVLNRLGTSGLLLTEHARADINQSIFLNVNADDIYYALNPATTTS